jgi:ribosomal protein S18 acetylase RimI-like enzyme
MTIEIRAARPEEFEEAGRVTALAYREFARPGETDWEEYSDRIADVGARAGTTTVLVAVEDGRVLGSVTLELDGRVEAGHEAADDVVPPHEVHVRMLGVDPAARGRGVGKALMLAAIALSRRRGKRLMTLNTTRRMKVAQGMYESMRFEQGPDRVFDDGFVLLSYSRSLELDVAAEDPSPD